MNKKTLPTNIPDHVRDALLSLPEEDRDLLTAAFEEDGTFIGLGFISNGSFIQWAEPWKQPHLRIIEDHYRQELINIHIRRIR